MTIADVAFAAFIVVLAGVLLVPTQRTRVRRTVFRNLDSAAENGYFAPGEHLYGASPDEVAYDMTCYSSDFEGADATTLTPYVRDWGRKRGYQL